MHSETIMLMINFILVILIIYGLFYKKQKKFLCSDPQPSIKSYSNLDNLDTPIVQTGIFIKDIPKIDINKNFVIINALVWFKFNNSVVHLDTLESFSFLNCINLEKKLVHLSIIQDETYVEYDIRLSFSNIFDHLYFPINDHRISIVMVHEKLTTHEMIYDVSGTAIQFDKNIKAEDMNVISGKVEAGYREKMNVAENHEKNTPYPAVLFCINLKKNGLKNIRLIIIPLVLIFWISSVVCLLAAIQPNQNYISTGISTLTLIMAYRYVIMQISPKVSYNTLTEKVYNLSLFFVFINFLLLISLVSFEKTSLASRVLISWAIICEPLYIVALIKIIFIENFLTPAKLTGAKKNTSIPINKINYDDIKNLFQPSLLLQLKSFILKPKIKINYENILSLFIQFKHLSQNKNNIINDFDECIIISEWGQDYQNICHLLETLIHEKKLKPDLTICSPRIFLIFNQHQIYQFDEWYKFLFIELILFLKNPNQIFILQNNSAIFKICNEKNQFLLENQLLHMIRSLPDHAIIQQDNHEIIIQSFKNRLTTKNSKAVITNINPTQYNRFDYQYLVNYVDKSILHWQIQSEFNHHFSMGIIYKDKPGYLHIKNEHRSHWLPLFYIQEISKTSPLIMKKQEISFYSSMDLSKTFSSFSKNLMRGLAIQFAQFNTKIAPEGKALDCYTLDDMGEPKKALINLDVFLKKSKHTPSILCPLGTNILAAFDNHIVKNDLVVLFPLTGGTQYRHPQYQNMYFFRGSYIDEAKLLLKHAKNKKNTKKVCVFYQNDDYGKGAVNGILNILKNEFDAYLLLDHERNKLQFLDFTNQINEFMPDSILFISAFAPSATFAHTIGLNRLAEMNLYAIASSAHQFSNYLKNLGISLIRTHLVPPLHAHLEIIENYHAAIHQYPLHFQASDESLEAFIVANIVSDMLEKTNFSLDPSDIETYFQTLKQVSFKGLEFNFDPNTRQLYHEIWVEEPNSSFSKDGR